MSNDFAKHIKKTTNANFKGMHMDQALDYAYQQILHTITNSAMQGGTSCVIDLQKDFYENLCQYIKKEVKFTATVPTYPTWELFLKRYVDARLRHDDNFTPLTAENADLIHFDIIRDGYLMIKFDWSNMF